MINDSRIFAGRGKDDARRELAVADTQRVDNPWEVLHDAGAQRADGVPHA